MHEGEGNVKENDVDDNNKKNRNRTRAISTLSLLTALPCCGSVQHGAMSELLLLSKNWSHLLRWKIHFRWFCFSLKWAGANDKFPTTPASFVRQQNSNFFFSLAKDMKDDESCDGNLPTVEEKVCFLFIQWAMLFARSHLKINANFSVLHHYWLAASSMRGKIKLQAEKWKRKAMREKFVW